MIKNVNSYTNYNSFKSNKTQNPSFNGRFNVLKYALNPNKKIDKTLMRNYLSLDKATIQREIDEGIKNPLFDLNKPLNRHKAGFFARLASLFSKENFKPTVGGTCNKDFAFNLRKVAYHIYDSVKYPEAAHKQLVSQSGFGLKDLSKLFDEFGSDKKSLKLANDLLNVSKKFGEKRLSFDTLFSILSSDYAPILKKDFAKHKKYITEIFRNHTNDDILSAMREYFAVFIKVG